MGYYYLNVNAVVLSLLRSCRNGKYIFNCTLVVERWSFICFTMQVSSALLSLQCGYFFRFFVRPGSLIGAKQLISHSRFMCSCNSEDLEILTILSYTCKEIHVRKDGPGNDLKWKLYALRRCWDTINYCVLFPALGFGEISFYLILLVQIKPRGKTLKFDIQLFYFLILCLWCCFFELKCKILK